MIGSYYMVKIGFEREYMKSTSNFKGFSVLKHIHL